MVIKGKMPKTFYSLFNAVAEFYSKTLSLILTLASVMIYHTSRITLLICQIYSQSSIKLICSCKEMMSTLSRSNPLSPPSCLSASYSKETYPAMNSTNFQASLNWIKKRAYQMMTFKCIVLTWKL